MYRESSVEQEGAVPVLDQSTSEFLGFHDNEADHFASPESPLAIFGDHTCKMRLFIEPFSVGPNVVPFVAHEDISPTRDWQNEIEVALASMDGFVALMTTDFHESDWTDQEVGFAFARGIPMIAVRLGKDPYGFIGKFQALTCEWSTAAKEIVKILINDDRMFSTYVSALRKCESWESGNTLAHALLGVEKLNRTQVNDLVSAYNETKKRHGSFAFNGTKPRYFGPGLVSFLNKFGPQKFRYVETEDDFLIESVQTTAP